ncbi:BTAD domain-containing putative transcriptional regulator [Amycolatopsis thailandensis]|uniref:BTAD domain-containing putative transcriptional regulator n=1 Tax=Amycolatopsis thailandensis TaxID=589330 RepID=UPI0036298EE9
MRLQLDLFGPVRAWRGDEEVVLGSAQRRALLAVLAFQANQVVTRSDLIDALWGEDAPASANGSIYTYISSLRAALDPARPRRQDEEVLASVGAGYKLRVDAESIDVVRFENLRERARMCQRGNDLAGALAALENALGLFQDEPMVGLPGPYATAQRERLKELRFEVVERRAKIMFDAGEHQQVLSELSQLTEDQPVREGLQSLHLLALYRCGRREEALRVFEAIRDHTIDELGVEPGAELTTRYAQIKADDPALWRGLTTATRGPIVTRPSQEDEPAQFVGRESELALVKTAVRRLGEGLGRAIWLEGEAGIGKTALVSQSLANAANATLITSRADELGQQTPLQVILNCLEISTNSPDPRRSKLARTLRSLPLDTADGVTAAIDAVVELVIRQCQEHPLIVVLDDLHWSDPASLEAWRRLAVASARLPLLLLGMSRRVAPGHHLAGRRAEIRKTGALIHQLDRLSTTEVHGLLDGLIGRPPGPVLLELARSAAGNPLFVREIVTALAGKEPKEPPSPGERPAFPPAALDAIGHHLGFLSAGAAEVLRWAALLDGDFTRDDLSVALGRPSAAFEHTLTELKAARLVTGNGDRLAFRHPVVREALYARNPGAIRIALHRHLAEALAEAGAPVERVAFQLLAAPVPVDKWFGTWLARRAYDLASRSPYAAIRLLQRSKACCTLAPAVRESLGIASARINFWLEQDITEESAQVIARTSSPDVAAEMHWLRAYSQLARGDRDQASREIQKSLVDRGTPSAWRALHEALLTRTRTESATSPTRAKTDSPLKLIPPQRTPSFGPAECYWSGHWDVPMSDLSRKLRAGPILARQTFAHSMALRRLTGVAAMITAHRGRPNDARTHLMSICTFGPAGEFGVDGADLRLATKALIAESQNRRTVAFDLLSNMLEYDDEAVCPWLPALVRLAVDLGEYTHAELATLVCERAPGQHVAALRCRAILEADPLIALSVAARQRSVGNRFGEAQAMEDAAALLAAQGKFIKAESALRIAEAGYGELGAVVDTQRARQRVAQGRDGAGR